LSRGALRIASSNPIRDIEVINLDGIPEAAALKLVGVDAGGAGAPSTLPSPGTPETRDGARVPPAPLVAGAYQFTAGQWMKVFTTAEDIVATVREKNALTWRQGWLDATDAKAFPLVTVPGSDGRNRGIRLHGKISPGVIQSINTFMFVRRKTMPIGGLASYRLYYQGMGVKPTVGLSHTPEAPSTIKSSSFNFFWVDPPLKAGDEFDMELIAIGDKLIGRFNGKLLPIVTDTRLTEGAVGFQTKHLVRDLEAINLDGLSEAEAMKLIGLDPQGQPLPDAKAQ